ncbi:hypothetical protein CSUI_007858 [Cystoisospora suis]|uniref:Uncharacterized protein n=1 Tax=Cystoisospora suis TaxID=483139 RepID=A0A2C6KPL8_9APIC|nr:hypothetical protein CSUI_007858 [Cystoisospora suis]
MRKDDQKYPLSLFLLILNCKVKERPTSEGSSYLSRERKKERKRERSVFGTSIASRLPPSSLLMSLQMNLR